MRQIKYFSDSVLFSYAQIFFSNRRWFGALLLIATMLSPEIGLMSLLGVVLSNLCAKLLKFDSERIRTGFYGFNGLLIGAASVYYYQLSFQLLLLIPVFILLTFLVTAVIENYFAVAFNLPGLSIPFIISLYIFIIFLFNYQNVHTQSHASYISNGLPKVLSTYFHALGIILLQPGLLTGVLIAIGLLMFSRVLFILSIATGFVSYYLAGLFLPNLSDGTLIVICFNAILMGFALGGSLIIPSRKSFILALFSTVFVVVMVGFFSQLMKTSGLPVLVLPFNFIVLSTLYSLKFRQEHSDMTLLYFPPGSPEENHYYHLNKKSRFQKFKALFADLPVYGEWQISQGFNGSHTHKEDWKYAWDFVVVDAQNSEYSGEGTMLEDYYCFKLPVVAPLDGEVVKVTDGIPNNKIGDVNIERNWGNTVIVNHSDGLYSSFSHLEPNSIKVKPGDKVHKGSIIGSCGNSGRSPIPHLHFQFQLNEKLGAHTYKFPFSNYISKEADTYRLHTFAFPEEKAIVQNVEVHKTIKQAFDFKYESKSNFKCEMNGKQFEEEWEVMISISNTLYIKSSQGASLSLFYTPKALYLTDFIGNKESALYYFSLLASHVPFCYHKELLWEDTFSPAVLQSTVIRFVSEFFLMFTETFEVKGAYKMSESQDDEKEYLLEGVISTKGRGLFGMYQNSLEGSVTIGQDGKINRILVSNKSKSFFKAEIISKSENK